LYDGEKEKLQMPGKRASESERREQILDAAFRVAVRKGLEGLTVREVAAEAGLSNGLVFFHFESKEALLLSLLDKLIHWMTSAEQRDFIKLMHEETTLEGEERERIALFLEFWVLGARHTVMREQLKLAIQRYREMFRVSATESMPLQTNISPAIIAAFGASLVIGCSLQSLLDANWFKAENPLQPAEEYITYLLKK
jgi:AcrR family transcriptional regulator